MKGGRISQGRVFLCLRCGKDGFLLDDLLATHGRESSYFMLRSVCPPEMTQMCFKSSPLVIFAGSSENGFHIYSISALIQPEWSAARELKPCPWGSESMEKVTSG